MQSFVACAILKFLVKYYNTCNITTLVRLTLFSQTTKTLNDEVFDSFFVYNSSNAAILSIISQDCIIVCLRRQTTSNNI
jgi:hypothetical protein